MEKKGPTKEPEDEQPETGEGGLEAGRTVSLCLPEGVLV